MFQKLFVSTALLTLFLWVFHIFLRFLFLFLRVQGDPMRLLFSKSASPHHGFAAYYTYLEKIFKADAVLHFGTHGSLEFMPGKQASVALLCHRVAVSDLDERWTFFSTRVPPKVRRAWYSNTNVSSTAIPTSRLCKSTKGTEEARNVHRYFLKKRKLPFPSPFPLLSRPAER